MALLHGMDPVTFGYLTGDEWEWTLAVLRRAEEIDHDRRKAMVEGIGVACANAVAKLFR